MLVDCEEDLLHIFLVAMTPSRMLVSQHPKQVLISNSFQDFKQNREFLELQVRFWIWTP